MDPVASFVDAYKNISALGFTGAVAFGLVAVVRGWVRMPREVDETRLGGDARVADVRKDCDEEKSQIEERFAYAEERRREERESRTAAEQRLAVLAAAVEAVVPLVQSVREELIRGRRS